MKFYDLDGGIVATKGQQLKSNVKIIFRIGKDKAREQKERLEPQLKRITSKFKKKKDSEPKDDVQTISMPNTEPVENSIALYSDDRVESSSED